MVFRPIKIFMDGLTAWRIPCNTISVCVCLLTRRRSESNGNLGDFGWGGAAGATVLVDPDIVFSMFCVHHMLNPQEHIYQPRLRNVLYNCL